jgi:hypothetical protein
MATYIIQDQIISLNRARLLRCFVLELYRYIYSSACHNGTERNGDIASVILKT